MALPECAPRAGFSLILLLVLATSSPAGDEFFVCDSTLDAVYSLIDLDGDGVIDPATEVILYYDYTSPGPDLSTPSHLLPYMDGLLLADGGTLDAILFLRDLNGDGDANDSLYAYRRRGGGALRRGPPRGKTQ